MECICYGRYAGKWGIDMKAGVFVEPGRVEVNNEVPIPKVEGENEAVIRVLRACV